MKATFCLLTACAAIVITGCDRKASSPPPASPATTQATEAASPSLGDKAGQVAWGVAGSVGNALKETGTQTGKAVGVGVATFTSGVVEGVGSAIPDPTKGAAVEVSEELKQMGVAVNGVECKFGDFTAYIVNEKPLAGRLIVKAIDEQGKEIGRASTPAKFEARGGQLVKFPMDSSISLKSAKRFELSYKAD